MCGVTRQSSAKRRLTVRNHGHAKSHATTTELMKKANALSPKIAFVFTTEHYYARHTPNENKLSHGSGERKWQL
jgi:hypothetical protein